MYNLFSSCAFFFIASTPPHLLDIACYHVLCLNWLLGGARQEWGSSTTETVGSTGGGLRSGVVSQSHM